jgi:oligoendopeptidase F
MNRLGWNGLGSSIFITTFTSIKYTTGFSAAASLAGQILQEGLPAVGRYVAFLKAGKGI